MRAWLPPWERTWITFKWTALSVALLFLIAPVAGNAACQSISVTPLPFGNYTGTALSFTATVTAHCDNGFAYIIGIGTGSSGNDASRTMHSGSNVLNYQMYSDAAYTSYWGTTTPGDTHYVNATGTGANQTFNIYGLVPAGQLVSPGSYGDAMIAFLSNTGLFVGLSISATVVANCTVSASTLAFGNYTGALLNNACAVTVTCTNTTSFDIGLDAGMAAGATVTTRMMTGPSSAKLNYALFRDGARTQNWGNTVGIDTLSGQGNGTPVAYSVFGQLPAGQYVAPGDYTDTVVATITY